MVTDWDVIVGGGGMSMCNVLTFGRIAGRNAAGANASSAAGQG